MTARLADRADAQRAANAIMALLGAAKNQDEKPWSDLAARSFTFLLRAYGEVSASGRFLYRNDEADVRFPSSANVRRTSSPHGR